MLKILSLTKIKWFNVYVHVFSISWSCYRCSLSPYKNNFVFLYINRKQCCDGVFCMSNDGVYGYVKE